METLARAANRGSISTGYDIDNSVKVENDNREYLRWTNFSTQGSTARKKKFTMSCWLKRTELGRQMVFWSTAQNGYFSFDAGDTLVWYQQYVGSGTQLGLRTTRVFRDTSAWYHMMIVVDTAQSTEANRVKMYINGVQETVFGTPNSYPSQNAEASNLYEQHLFLGEWGGGSTGFSGYIADYYFLSEIAAAPTDLGEFDEDSGIWKPKAYGGTIATPSQFLEFKDGADLGTATSGLDADTMNNLTAADQATDTPTNSFCTLNPLYAMTYPLTISEGGTKSVASGAVAQWQSAKGSMAVNNGKWYWETSNFTEMNTFIGLQSADLNGVYNGAYTLNVPLNDNNLYFSDPSNRSEGFTTTKATSDVWGLALNMDDGQLSVYRNGTLQNATVSIDGLIGNGPYTPIISQYASATNASTNFGGYNSGKAISSAASDGNGYGNFEYAPPSGFYALCTKNLAEYG